MGETIKQTKLKRAGRAVREAEGRAMKQAL